MKQYIIYIYPSYSSFIKKDIDFLSKKFTLKSPKHNWLNSKLAPIRFVQQFFFLIKNIHSCKVIYVMFGGYWSLLPTIFAKVFNKPVYIILGGTDCVSFPSLKYGSLRKPILAYFIKWSYKLCDKLLPVSESLVFCENNYYHKSKYKHQGYKFFFPDISTPYKVIYNGFDINYFNDNKHEKISNSFICIAVINDMLRFKLKGIDIILKLANIYQDCSFTIIGISKNVIQQLSFIPENVNIYPFLCQDDFKKYLLKSEFIMQLSISEGFPNSLCEAMLCRCIPIGSSVGAIPNIIKDSGYIIESSKIKYIETKFNDIISSNKTDRQDLAEKARNRIINNFSISKRQNAFYELINTK